MESWGISLIKLGFLQEVPQTEKMQTSKMSELWGRGLKEGSLIASATLELGLAPLRLQWRYLGCVFKSWGPKEK